MTKVHCINKSCKYMNENCECSKEDIFLFPEVHSRIYDEEIITKNGCADFSFSDSALDELQKSFREPFRKDIN